MQQHLLTYEDFQRWGAIGGKKSHRMLPSVQAKQMGLLSAEVRRRKSRSQNQEEPTKAPHGTQEWAASNLNIQQGCEHNCKYCYAKSMAIRFKRSTADNWTDTELRPAAIDDSYGKKDGTIMFPTTHDITPSNIEKYILVLMKLMVAGNRVLIVSKPHLLCVKQICTTFTLFKHRILFRFTIGSTDDKVLKYWEPEAPLFSERLMALKWAREQGYDTSVSSEPMLDTNIDTLLKAVRPYVSDAIWLGRVNQIKSALAQNCPKDKEARNKADELLSLQNDDWVKGLYRKYRKDKMIKWKDSIKKVVGLERPAMAGMDV